MKGVSCLRGWLATDSDFIMYLCCVCLNNLSPGIYFSVSQFSSAFLWYTVSASKVRLRYIKRKWKYSVLVAATGTSGFYYSYITYSHLYQHLNKILKSPPSLPPTAPH